MKKTFKFSLVISAVLILALIFVGCGPKKLSAHDAYKAAQNNLLEAKNYTMKVDAKYDLKLEEGAEVPEEIKAQLEMLKDSDYSMFIKIDGENKKLFTDMKFEVSGISMAFDIFASKDKINFKMPMVPSRVQFDKAELKDVIEKIESKMPGALPAIKEGKTFAEALDIDFITGDLVDKISSIYAKIQKKSIELYPASNIKDLGKTEFELSSGKKSLRTLELTMDGDMMLSYYEKLIKSLVEDKELSEEVKSLVKELTQKYSNEEITDEMFDDAIAEALKAFENEDFKSKPEYKYFVDLMKASMSDTKITLGLDDKNYILAMKGDVVIDYGKMSEVDVPGVENTEEMKSELEKLKGVKLNMKANYEISDYNKTVVEPIVEDEMMNLKQLIEQFSGLSL